MAPSTRPCSMSCCGTPVLLDPCSSREETGRWNWSSSWPCHRCGLQEQRPWRGQSRATSQLARLIFSWSHPCVRRVVGGARSVGLHPWPATRARQVGYDGQAQRADSAGHPQVAEGANFLSVRSKSTTNNLGKHPSCIDCQLPDTVVTHHR